MAESAHSPTCVCYDCLPGGKREHRVRPWPAKASECEHPDGPIGIMAQGELRLVIPTLGGGSIELCRLCGTVVRREGPPVLEEPAS